MAHNQRTGMSASDPD